MAGFRSNLQLGVKLGSGHFGEVFLGQDPVHGEVAVKVLSRKPFDTDAEWDAFRAAFLKEGQNLSKAKHHNVVQVYHILEAPTSDSLWLCMAYCSGGSLQSIFEVAPMQVDTVRKVGTEILFGLSALHARTMLHRDIKPGNILLDARGIALISDFGLVTDDLILGYGSQAGYSDHLAFEIWQGQGTSVRTDIWAFGMTLYRLLHGQTWYEETARPQTVISNGNFAKSLRWLPHVPKPWRRAIRNMMHDDPASRCQSADLALNLLGRLPLPAPWSTRVTPDLVRWELRRSTRLNVVEWLRPAPRRHKWSAWSEPLGRGRRMTLGGSQTEMTARQAIVELEAYFA